MDENSNMRFLYVFKMIIENLKKMHDDLENRKDANEPPEIVHFSMNYYGVVDKFLDTKDLVTCAYIRALGEEADASYNILALKKISENNLSNKVVLGLQFQNVLEISKLKNELKDIGGKFFIEGYNQDYLVFSKEQENIQTIKLIEDPEKTKATYNLLSSVQSYCDKIKILINTVRREIELERENEIEKQKELEIEEKIQKRRFIAEGLVTENDKTIIDKCEEEYKQSINSIDNEVGAFISAGKEMQGITLFNKYLNSILSVHELLGSLYQIIYSSTDLLRHFGSAKLNILDYEIIPLKQQLLGREYSDEVIDKVVEDSLREIGFHRKHWYIKSSILSEIEYMIYTLRILIEPEYIPLDSGKDDDVDKPNRYINKSVKMSVWRRDGGKCVECGTQEKLEYDHIIPIVKGGSNTERNIQLLCEKCNRHKSANIQ